MCHAMLPGMADAIVNANDFSALRARERTLYDDFSKATDRIRALEAALSEATWLLREGLRRSGVQVERNADKAQRGFGLHASEASIRPDQRPARYDALAGVYEGTDSS
jgi:hypothetical protein